MFHTSRHVRDGAVALLVLIGTTLVATPPAAAAEMRVALRADGAVQARGAALVVVTTVTCDPGAFRVRLDIRVTQRLSDGKLVHGSGGADRVSCTGSPESLRIAIRAAGEPSGFPSSAPPFAATSAFVSASLRDCDQGCDGPSASRTVKLARDVPTFSRPRSATRQSRIYLDAATATVEAGGAGATVRVPYKCYPTGTSESLSVVLLQRTSLDTVTSSIIFPGWPCTGVKRVGVAVFHAEADLWRQGPAYLIVSGEFCTFPGSEDCDRPYAHTTVTVTAPTI
jgi:hypothetical protein